MKQGEFYRVALGGCCPKRCEILSFTPDMVKFKQISNNEIKEMTLTEFSRKAYKEHFMPLKNPLVMDRKPGTISGPRKTNGPRPFQNPLLSRK